MTGIDYLFPCLSPESADPQSIPTRLLREELERELHQRRASYPGRVDKGRMHAHDAEQGINLMRGLVEHYRRVEAMDAWYEGRDTPQGEALWQAHLKQDAIAGQALQPFRWSEVVCALQREIILRRRYYPQWIAGGTLEPIRARHQIERIEAVHFHWWVGMANFMPDHLHHKQDAMRKPGPEREEFQRCCREHRARFDYAAGRGAYVTAPEEQKELAL
ncbi:hypothetical protein [Sphingobium sp. LSP13-1-1.1]|uniref:hypothetical protein n=1 Tax=Sphingobium sp. LSP13-1-1.1 TaxID=3135234 RepID=UPI00343F8325